MFTFQIAITHFISLCSSTFYAVELGKLSGTDDGYEKPLPNLRAPKPESVVRKLPQAVELERLLSEQEQEQEPKDETPVSTTSLVQASVHPPTHVRQSPDGSPKPIAVAPEAPVVVVNDVSKTSTQQPSTAAAAAASPKPASAQRPSIAPKPKNIEIHKTYENHQFIPLSVMNRPKTLTLASTEILIPLESPTKESDVTQTAEYASSAVNGTVIKRQKSLPNFTSGNLHSSYIDMGDVNGAIAKRLKAKAEKKTVDEAKLLSDAHKYEQVNNETSQMSTSPAQKHRARTLPPVPVAKFTAKETKTV